MIKNLTYLVRNPALLARYHRLFIVSLLGFSSGLPLALLGGSLQAWFTTAGVDIVSIGALSLVQLPYVWKFLWAPMLDRYTLPFLSRRRGWMLIMQILLFALFMLIVSFDPASHGMIIGGLALIIALFSATQDVVIDAYRTELLPDDERGLGTALFVGGYRLALILAGGIGFILAQYMGWAMTYRLIGGCMVIGIAATLLGREKSQTLSPSGSILNVLIDSVKAFVARNNNLNHVILILLLVILYKFGEAFAQTLITPFLQRGLGFSLAEIGLINKVMAVIATILGAFFGGVLMMRLGLYRSLLYFGILQAVTNLLYMLLAFVGHNFPVAVVAVFSDHLCSGMGTAAFLALLMSLCDKRYTATQFACLSALSSIGRVITGPLAGIIVKHVGWAPFFFWTFIVSLPGILLLWSLKNLTFFTTSVATTDKL